MKAEPVNRMDERPVSDLEPTSKAWAGVLVLKGCCFEATAESDAKSSGLCRVFSLPGGRDDTPIC